MVSCSPLCKTPARTQLSELRGEIAQSAPWQFFEAMDVTGKATRLCGKSRTWLH